MLPGSAENHAPPLPHCPPTSWHDEKLVPLEPVHESVVALPLVTEEGFAVSDVSVVGVGEGGGGGGGGWVT